MKKHRKYARYIIFMVFLVLFVPNRKPVSLEWFGLLALFIAVIILFEFIEKSRKNRIKKWGELNKRPSKTSYISKFSFLYGLPISLIISLLIYSKSSPISLLIFIILPLILLFGWIGQLEWQKSYEEAISEKYKNHV
jgi:hypothetical protein